MSTTLLSSFSATIDQSFKPIDPSNRSQVTNAMSVTIDQTFKPLGPANTTLVAKAIGATITPDYLVPTYVDKFGLRTYKKR